MIPMLWTAHQPGRYLDLGDSLLGDVEEMHEQSTYRVLR